MLCTNLEQMQRARAGGYAIPAINTQGGCYDIIMAVCRAAQEMRSPVILAHYAATGAYSGHDFFVNVARFCAEKVDVPVSIHLDHGDGFALCMEALRLGFTSLMIDGSALPVAENAALTQRVCDVARCFGVPVEAEIGELQRLGPDGVPVGRRNVADPEQVRAFLQLCHPDTLAVGIGNAHGFYASRPDIRLDVLEAVRSFCDLPLVLHGCTGMSEQVVRDAVRLGVAKINFGTEVRYKYLEHLKAGLETQHDGHSWKVSQYASGALVEDIKRIIALSGSEGRA